MFTADNSFSAIQVKCDCEVSHGALAFFDKFKPIIFLIFFAYNLLDDRTS